MSDDLTKDDLTKEELELIGYREVSHCEEYIETKWNMKVQGFFALEEYKSRGEVHTRRIGYYISMVELHARLSMIVGYSTYNGIKPHKEK